MRDQPFQKLDESWRRGLTVALIGLLLVGPAYAQPGWTEVHDMLGQGGSCPKQLAGSAPVYPLASLRKGEEGRVVVGLCVDERGKPSSFEILQSSGAARLDIATTLWSCGRAYVPEVDRRGVPRSSCAAVSEFTWKLEDFPEAYRFVWDASGSPIYVEGSAGDRSRK